ncbi:MAG: hypothetical protein ACTHKL_17880 [Streptosporangiaceae bacterium]
MNEPDRPKAGDGPTLRAAMNGRDSLPEHVWQTGDGGDDQYIFPGEQFGSRMGAGLVGFSFIQAAVRRCARIWITLAVLGLLAGVGFSVARPPGYQAYTKILLVQPPGAQTGWIADDQALAQTTGVAGMAARRLGLQESGATFISTYTVVALTDKVLAITVKAPSPQEAVQRAEALGQAFIDFRAQTFRRQERSFTQGFQEQIARAEQRVALLSGDLRTQAATALHVLKDTGNTDEAEMQLATSAAIRGSGPLDNGVLVKPSVKKRMALFGVGGLMAGLVLGLGIVVVGALASRRLRRRDDVASALGAPVRLSVPKGGLSPRRLRRKGLAAAESPSLERIMVHLATAAVPTSAGFASIAVVPADDVEVAAVCIASLALSSAQQGLRVVMADLCSGAPGARLLGMNDAGVQRVRVGDTSLIVGVPEQETALPEGPIKVSTSRRRSEKSPVAAACASADLVLTLAVLDPALGGDHLADWASGVVVFVTTGRSSAERIHAVGEMIRAAGIRSVSAVLVGADKTDQSLGSAGMQAADQTAFPDGSGGDDVGMTPPVDIRAPRR